MISQTMKKPEIAANKRKKFPVSLTFLSIIIMTILLALGTWQVNRLEWKQQLLADIDQKLISPPLQFDEVEKMNNAGQNIDYQPVTVTGHFKHEAERHFLATYNSYAGFFIYTPLEMSDGRLVLINRGFVPYDLKEPELRSEGQSNDLVSITGLARAKLQDKPSRLLPDNDPVKNIFYWKDLELMAKSSGLPEDRFVDFFIDANNAPNPGGFPIGGVTIIDLPNSHLQYAFTWYGLAFAFLCVYIAYMVRWYRSRD